MATAVLRREKRFSGLRPVEPSRDLTKVARLIQTAFADDLDRSGYSMLREMRNVGRLGPLLWWFEQGQTGLSDLLAGFVWVEDDQVVGNVTISQVSPNSHRWIISNVAVAPSYRGRGIARALMQAAMDFIASRHGKIVSLQVRDDNAVALHIYRSIGFHDVFGTSYLRHNSLPAVKPLALNADGMQLRRFEATDSQLAFQLACAATPEAVQSEQPIRSSRYALAFETRLADWFKELVGSGPPLRLVVENHSRLDAMVTAEPSAWHSEGSITLIVHPSARGMVEKELVSHALSHLRRWSQDVAVTRHPTYHPEGMAAFTSFGFREERTLLWMKCEL
jgi:ribosomal protein S18 acetylase RimI-like enzyme